MSRPFVLPMWQAFLQWEMKSAPLPKEGAAFLVCILQAHLRIEGYSSIRNCIRKNILVLSP